MNPVTDEQLFSPRRFPVLGPAGRAMLRQLVDHPNAPLYRDFSGHRLTRLGVWQARWRQWQVMNAEIIQFLLGLLRAQRRTELHGIVYDGYLPCVRVLKADEERGLNRLGR